ncbi:MAG TPA: YCF48-related protein, partial [Saprospiraceae bacterium]|nr:YCF48-related protein [Saprospiraceae bacterium]
MKYYIKQFLFLLFNLLFITTFSQWNNSNSINGNSTVTFNASKVLPNNTIFLIGDDGLTLFNRSGVIYKSTDNGVSFTKTNTLPKAYQLSSANFIDNNNGFVFGQTQSFKGFIARTTDGGVSWISDSINETEQLKSNSFINSQIGYVADFTLGNLKLYKTINGGNRWSMICDKYYQSGAVNDLQFLTENLGFICTQTKTSSFRYAKVMRTTDGGNNWTTLKYSLDEDYTSIHFFDYYNGFVLTFSGKIYKTTNAGTTWTLVRNSTDIQNCNELKFINPIVGYVISADSILRTTDAGNTWTNIHNISTLSLFGYNTLDVNSNGIGIAAGGVGSFYSYTNNFGGTSSNNTISSAYISGYDSTCTGQNGTIRFDFTGTPPWSISYSNGTTTLSETNITSTPFFIPVPTTATRQVYTINSFSSNGINSVNYYGKAILSVLNSQAVSATISGTKAICISDSTKLSVQLKGNKPFTFTYSDGIG